jgi:hypothetical protein
MFKKSGTNGPYAFDAATSSSLAFLSAQLELVTPTLVKPLSSMTHPRDISVKFGGGMPDYLTAYASDYASTGTNQYGLQGTNNTDVPMIQVNVVKGVWHTWLWQVGFLITVIDLKKLETAARSGQPAPFSLQTLLEDGVTLVWNKAMEVVTYNGWMGDPGLLNNPVVTNSLAPMNAAATSRNWSRKAPSEIQSDVNFALTQAVGQAVYAADAFPDTCLIDYGAFNSLFSPMVLGGVGGFESVGRYIEANNIARANGVDFKFKPVANPWISTIGTGGVGRACFYRNDENNVLLHAPQPPQKVFTVPSVKDGGSYETLFNGCIGQPQFKRNQSFYYLDGIS